MKMIWKYTLKVTDSQGLVMPEGAELLSVGNQRGNLCLWALVPVGKGAGGEECRWVEIHGTGNPIQTETGLERRFIGTAIIEPFVWHVFERIEGKNEERSRS